MRCHVPALLFVPIVVAAAGAAGCADPDSDLQAIVIRSAALRDVQLAVLGFFGGTVEGTATLEAERLDNGAPVVAPLVLSGGIAGPLFGITADSDWQEVELELPEGEVRAGDLTGTFEGTAAAGAFVAGASQHRLQNERGVSLQTRSFAWGFGFVFGFQWLGVEVDRGGENLPNDDPADNGPSPP
jgi:hypothetical protein